MSRIIAIAVIGAFATSEEILDPAEKSLLEGLEKKDLEKFVPPLKWARVLSVYDGDTFTVGAQLYPEVGGAHLFNIRMLGIDTPEMRGKCPAEKKAAKEAKMALKEKIDGKIVRLEDVGNDKYGGRYDATAYLYEDDETPLESLNDFMIENGFAYPYDGGKKTNHWC